MSNYSQNDLNEMLMTIRTRSVAYKEDRPQAKLSMPN